VAAGGDAVDNAVLLRIAEAASEAGIDDPRALARAAAESGILSGVGSTEPPRAEVPALPAPERG
jgi:hypothetical protein